MKHIERRYLLQNKTENTVESSTKSKIEFIPVEKIDFEVLKSKRKGNIIFIESENNYIYPIIYQKSKPKDFFIPMPDPTLIYFNNAQMAYKLVENEKAKLIDKLDFEKLKNEDVRNEVFSFFGLSSQFVIFLFTSIESFVNQIIPIDFIYKKEMTNKTEVYDSMQIQKSLSFDEKLKKVLPKCTNKNFFDKQTPTNQHIENLKKFRDEIVHTKKDTKNSILFYDALVSKSFNFKYEETIYAVQKFMNHYKSDYIVECKCGEDF